VRLSFASETLPTRAARGRLRLQTVEYCAIIAQVRGDVMEHMTHMTHVPPMQTVLHEDEQRRNHRIIVLYTLFLSVAFLIAGLVAALVTRETAFWVNLMRIFTSPSKLVTDYYALGGLAATLFNVAICGLSCNLIIIISHTKANATTFAGYMLVVAHCFYGLNFLNMWPSILGVVVYCLVTKRHISENVHIAFFSTALAPFISEFLFRYTLGEAFSTTNPQVTVLGIILAVLFGLASGFVVPALLPGTTAMHRGFNMYKAGLAIGILGIFLNAFLFQSLGLQSSTTVTVENEAYYALPYAYRGFINIFLAVIFVSTLTVGFFLNGRSFHGYGKLWRCTGYGVDFIDKFKMPLCLVNIGIYGLCILAYLNIVFILPEIFSALPKGVGFTGATTGVVFAALTFAADGQQPRTVFPIVVGYATLFGLVCAICAIAKLQIPWTLSSQAYINGLAFATGLCPFAGKYGFRVGVLAGFLSAVICTSTATMHGGFVLYNGGFTAGLTALVLLPILDFYKVKPRFDTDM